MTVFQVFIIQVHEVMPLKCPWLFCLLYRITHLALKNFALNMTHAPLHWPYVTELFCWFWLYQGLVKRPVQEFRPQRWKQPALGVSRGPWQRIKSSLRIMSESLHLAQISIELYLANFLLSLTMWCWWVYVFLMDNH